VNLLVFMACFPFQIVKIMPDSLLLSGTVSWCRVTSHSISTQFYV